MTWRRFLLLLRYLPPECAFGAIAQQQQSGGTAPPIRHIKGKKLESVLNDFFGTA